MADQIPLAIRLWRFTAAGLAATAIHAAAAWLLIAVGLGAGWANALATIIAATASYLMHTFWSFGATPATGNALRFVVVVAFCAAVAGLAARAIAGATGSSNLSILAAVIIVPPLSFILHNAWTYRR
jgi:putative flippase GtrA